MIPSPPVQMRQEYDVIMSADLDKMIEKVNWCAKNGGWRVNGSMVMDEDGFYQPIVREIRQETGDSNV